MGRTRELDAELFVRDLERPELGEASFQACTSEQLEAFNIFGEVARRGHGELVVRAEGPDAEEAIKIVQGVFDGPIPTQGEAASGVVGATKAVVREGAEARMRELIEEHPDTPAASFAQWWLRSRGGG